MVKAASLGEESQNGSPRRLEKNLHAGVHECLGRRRTLCRWPLLPTDFEDSAWCRSRARPFVTSTQHPGRLPTHVFMERPSSAGDYGFFGFHDMPRIFARGGLGPACALPLLTLSLPTLLPTLMQIQHANPRPRRTRMPPQVMLFTYTDRDGFVPPSERGHRLLTGRGGELSHLGEAVVNMPLRTTCSSGGPRVKQATEQTGGVPKQATRPTRQGVSRTAASIQAHLARENSFKASPS